MICRRYCKSPTLWKIKGTNNTPPPPLSFNGKNFCSNKFLILFQGGGKDSQNLLPYSTYSVYSTLCISSLLININTFTPTSHFLVTVRLLTAKTYQKAIFRLCTLWPFVYRRYILSASEVQAYTESKIWRWFSGWELTQQFDFSPPLSFCFHAMMFFQ